jgi:hypothetical protein
MTKKERDEYFATIDWTKTSIATAAKETGMQYMGAYQRWKKSGGPKPPRKHIWSTVDWSLRTIDIAAQLGIKPTTVSMARKKFAPETCQHKPSRKKEVAA